MSFAETSSIVGFQPMISWVHRLRSARLPYATQCVDWHLSNSKFDDVRMSASTNKTVSSAHHSQPLGPNINDRFRLLILPHLDAAYSLARYLVRDSSRAEDVVQDAYLRAFVAFKNFRGGDAKSWLLAIVRNCSMTDLSKRDKTTPLTKHEESAEDSNHSTSRQSVNDATPESQALCDEATTTLRKLIAALPPAMREVLILRELDELSYREIADVVEAPIGTVMSRLARARALLSLEFRRAHGGISL